jgi:hypothetical protein
MIPYLPCRNKIVFFGTPDNQTISLCNNQIQEYIHTHTFSNDNNTTLQSSENSVIENGDVIEIVNGHSIIRSFDTFHQNDDNIRKALYEKLFPILKIKRKNVLLIGGECYLYATLCNADNIYCYSDDEKIISDCKRNNSSRLSVLSELINYSTINLPTIEFDLCILNVSKKGLGKHLSKIVSSLLSRCETYYISCNEKSFLKDGLSYQDKWDFGNSLYSISLYLLK